MGINTMRCPTKLHPWSTFNFLIWDMLPIMKNTDFTCYADDNTTFVVR